MNEHRPTSVAPVDQISRSIVFLRGQKVMPDAALASLYSTPTKRFNEQVRRNIARFPPDFMFQVTSDEAEILRSHFATSNEATEKRGGRRYLPYVFTEHGAIMAAMILNSQRAVEMSVYEVYAAIRALMTPPTPRKRPIGFTADISAEVA